MAEHGLGRYHPQTEVGLGGLTAILQQVIRGGVTPGSKGNGSEIEP